MCDADVERKRERYSAVSAVDLLLQLEASSADKKTVQLLCWRETSHSRQASAGRPWVGVDGVALSASQAAKDVLTKILSHRASPRLTRSCSRSGLLNLNGSTWTADDHSSRKSLQVRAKRFFSSMQS